MFYDTAPARINAPWIWSVFNLLLKWEFCVLVRPPALDVTDRRHRSLGERVIF